MLLNTKHSGCADRGAGDGARLAGRDDGDDGDDGADGADPEDVAAGTVPVEAGTRTGGFGVSPGGAIVTISTQCSP